MAEVTDKDLNKIEKMLNTTISNLLYGGSGDPSWGECAGAAACFKVLKILNLKIKNEESVQQELKANSLHNEDFLK